jgi:hypothetical protein
MRYAAARMAALLHAVAAHAAETRDDLVKISE